ncbi:MAG: bifunctional DNA-formamidopyrimidine glycosylase/DNA-(apurinic or apyrimidinic site) lyase [Alphaproteobacteria bacterium]
MPELPEVETVRRGLEPVLQGARLSRVIANRADLRFPLPANFVRRLQGARIEKLSRRAKYLLATLDTGETLAMHLGMSGRFTIIDAKRQPGDFYYSNPPDPAHTHVVFETEKGARVEYNDPRRFGYMELIPTAELETSKLFAGLGPEPLGNEFNADALAEGFRGRKQNVKATLLDQRVVAGLGNIYVCEALYRAHISPRKAAGKVTAPQREKLAHAVRVVLKEAIEAGGSSLKDYARADGALGYFQHRFRVYDREGEPCRTKGCGGVIKRFVQAGRSTFYCPVCQR